MCRCIVGALGGITSPWELAIAFAENAVANGVELLLSSR